MIAILGVIVYYVRASTKIDPLFKTIIYVVAVIAVVVLLLQRLGMWTELKNFKVGLGSIQNTTQIIKI